MSKLMGNTSVVYRCNNGGGVHADTGTTKKAKWGDMPDNKVA